MIFAVFVDIFHDFGGFFATRIRIRFIEADPDPHVSGSATLNETIDDDLTINDGG